MRFRNGAVARYHVVKDRSLGVAVKPWKLDVRNGYARFDERGRERSGRHGWEFCRV